MPADRIAFVSPRFPGQGAVGGAETLLWNLARHARSIGFSVDFLTTCAQSHFSWENTLPPGSRTVDGVEVHFFPVDPRDVSAFLSVQQKIDRSVPVSPEDQELWLRNGVQSAALSAHLSANASAYRAVLAGPYLFGLTVSAARAIPSRFLLVPCLHDEPFARLSVIRDMFASVAGCLFNSDAERDLARELYGFPAARSAVVGMGLDPFPVDPAAFAEKHRLPAPYVLFSGRREPLKGTPLLCDYMLAFRQRTGRDVRLVFTGSGDIPADPALLPAVLDVGFVSEREKHEAMAGALAFVHPSLNESFGIVLLEAFLASTPALVHARSRVLVSQCRAARAGLWFRHYPDFEEQLLFLLDHPAARDALGANGRAFVSSTYAWPAIEARLRSAISSLL